MNPAKSKLVELYGDEHPAFGSYLECMTRSYFTGLAAFSLAFSSTYLAQNLLKKHIPYSPKFFILLSSAIGAVCSYKISTKRTLVCQAAWMAAEDKSTYFTQAEAQNNSK